MTVTLGILALLEAKPGKGGELAAFLEAGRAGVSRFWGGARLVLRT
jgi:hypothetical protein